MTGSHIHFVDTGNDPTSSHNYVQVATPKSPNSDSAWSDTEDGHISIHPDHNRILKKKLTDQIDVEILLKHREFKLIENEILKVEQTMQTLEKLHNDEKYGEYMTHLITLKRKANGILVQEQSQQQPLDPLSNSAGLTITRSSLRPSSSVSNPTNNSNTNNSKDHRTSYGGIPSLVLPNGQKNCVHRLSNGKLVKISCPVCSRADFGSAQGFLNHARLLHQLEFKSQGDVAIKCGVELTDWENELWLKQQQQLNPLFDVETEILNAKKQKTNKSEIKEKSKVKYLTKVVTEDQETFNELVKDVTSKDSIEFEDDEAESPGGTTIISNPSNSKSHNRRKSRGGLSAVKFEEDLVIVSNLSDISAEDIKLTPAQRRRVPSIPNPLRTRSKSSRENSR